MKLEELQSLEGHDDRVWSVSWSPSGELLASTSGDKTVRIWARDSQGKWYCKVRQSADRITPRPSFSL